MTKMLMICLGYQGLAVVLGEMSFKKKGFPRKEMTPTKTIMSRHVTLKMRKLEDYFLSFWNGSLHLFFLNQGSTTLFHIRANPWILPMNHQPPLTPELLALHSLVAGNWLFGILAHFMARQGVAKVFQKEGRRFFLGKLSPQKKLSDGCYVHHLKKKSDYD